MRGDFSSKEPLTLPSPSRGEGLLGKFAKCIVQVQVYLAETVRNYRRFSIECSKKEDGMTTVTNIGPVQTNLGESTPSTSSLLNQPVVDFASLIDELISRSSSKPKGNEAAIQAEQALEAFERKLDLLSGMAQQAQITMNSAPPLPGGFSSPQAQAYFYAKSLLAQVGLPGGVLEVV